MVAVVVVAVAVVEPEAIVPVADLLRRRVVQVDPAHFDHGVAAASGRRSGLQCRRQSEHTLP